MLFLRTGSAASELEATLLRKKHKRSVERGHSWGSEEWMSPAEQPAREGARRQLLAPWSKLGFYWQDKNIHKWYDGGICGASSYLLEQVKAAFIKRQGTVGFVCKHPTPPKRPQRLLLCGFLEVFTDQQQTCLYCSLSRWGLELQGAGWCSGQRMHTLHRDAGTKPLR